MSEKKVIDLKHLQQCLAGTLIPRSQAIPPDFSSEEPEPKNIQEGSAQKSTDEASMSKNETDKVILRGGAMIPKSELAPTQLPDATTPAPPNTNGVIIPVNPPPPPPPESGGGKEE